MGIFLKKKKDHSLIPPVRWGSSVWSLCVWFHLGTPPTVQIDDFIQLFVIDWWPVQVVTCLLPLHNFLEI